MFDNTVSFIVFQGMKSSFLIAVHHNYQKYVTDALVQLQYLYFLLVLCTLHTQSCILYCDSSQKAHSHMDTSLLTSSLQLSEKQWYRSRIEPRSYHTAGSHDQQQHYHTPTPQQKYNFANNLILSSANTTFCFYFHCRHPVFQSNEGKSGGMEAFIRY